MGDLRDDINDSWGADKNREQAEEVLAYLFDLQNLPDRPVRVVYSLEISMLLVIQQFIPGIPRIVRLNRPFPTS